MHYTLHVLLHLLFLVVRLWTIPLSIEHLLDNSRTARRSPLGNSITIHPDSIAHNPPGACPMNSILLGCVSSGG